MVPDISFTNLYGLTDVCRLKKTGSFTPDWVRDYKVENYGANRKVRVPIDEGSGLRVTKLEIQDNVPADVNHALTESQALYLLVSPKYRIFYVGMTAKGFPTGVFGSGGRLTHHVRKMLAIKNGAGTSHTGGWVQHALERYQDLVTRFNGQEMACAALRDSDLLGDVLISFGTSGSSWTSKDHEGIAQDYFQKRFHELSGKSFACMNTQGTSRKSATVIEPENLKGTIAG